MDPSCSQLQEKLVKATDLGDVLAYFFDHFGENPDFLDLGERIQDPVIEETLRVTVGQLAGRDAPIENVLLIRLADDEFVHGGFTVKGNIGTFFYFERIRMGLAAVADMRSGETRMARFTVSRPASGPSRN